jgi:hypothetical protein
MCGGTIQAAFAAYAAYAECLVWQYAAPSLVLVTQCDVAAASRTWQAERLLPSVMRAEGGKLCVSVVCAILVYNQARLPVPLLTSLWVYVHAPARCMVLLHYNHIVHVLLCSCVLCAGCLKRHCLVVVQRAFVTPYLAVVQRACCSCAKSCLRDRGGTHSVQPWTCCYGMLPPSLMSAATHCR